MVTGQRVRATVAVTLPAPPPRLGDHAIQALLEHDERTSEAVNVLARLAAFGWDVHAAAAGPAPDGSVTYLAVGDVADEQTARVKAMAAGAGDLPLTLT